MRIGQIFGRILFIAFLLFRGMQHIHKPDDWGTKFAAKYNEFFDVTSKLPHVIQNVPAKWLGLLHPTHISTYATTYSRYIGYTELVLAFSIVIEIPLFPLVGATFLAVESIVFFNPFNPKLGGEIYYLIVNLALAGIVYMMAFAAPLFKIPLPQKVSAPGKTPIRAEKKPVTAEKQATKGDETTPKASAKDVAGGRSKK